MGWNDLGRDIYISNLIRNQEAKIKGLENKVQILKEALEEIERFQVLTRQDIALPMAIAREALGVISANKI